MFTGDGREIILPNSQITTAPIVNYTVRGERRIDLAVPMAFGEDLSALREALLHLAKTNARVKSVPAPEVLVTAMGDGMVTLQLRAWVASRDFALVNSELLESVLAEFGRRGLRSPLPQREVHVHHHNGPALPPAVDAGLDPSL
jgi:small-conductance mechanosensitive channel